MPLENCTTLKISELYVLHISYEPVLLKKDFNDNYFVLWLNCCIPIILLYFKTRKLSFFPVTLKVYWQKHFPAMESNFYMKQFTVEIFDWSFSEYQTHFG